MGREGEMNLWSSMILVAVFILLFPEGTEILAII